MHIVANLLAHLVGQHLLQFLPDFLLQLLHPILVMSVSWAAAEPTAPPTFLESPPPNSSNLGPRVYLVP